MTICMDSVVTARRATQPASGGAIPASMLHFRAGQWVDARALVKRFHYSGRFPNSIKFIGTLHLAGGLFGDFGEAVAACVFTVPPTRWREEVLELSRLVRREDARVAAT